MTWCLSTLDNLALAREALDVMPVLATGRRLPSLKAELEADLVSSHYHDSQHHSMPYIKYYGVPTTVQGENPDYTLPTKALMHGQTGMTSLSIPNVSRLRS